MDIKIIYGDFLLSICISRTYQPTCCFNSKLLKMVKIKILRFKIVFTIVGAVGGFLYWKLIGCTSGTCPIQSVWYYSTLWGLAMGYLISDLLGSFIWKQAIKNE
jgi:hypothetical protein